MSSLPTVQDIMVKSTVHLSPDMDAYEAVDLVSAKKIAGVPVVDAEDRLVGFVTEKDCLRLQVTSHQYNMTGRRGSVPERRGRKRKRRGPLSLAHLSRGRLHR